MLDQRYRTGGIKRAAFLPFILVSSLAANTNTLDRPNDPVIIRGENFEDFEGAPIEELFLLAFDAVNQSWRMIPFQIDEKDVSGAFLFGGASDQVAGLDANDELAFMASDGGDEANIWIDDVDSRNYPRQAIRLVDLLDPESVTTAWAYLYRSTTLTQDFSEDYVTYTPSANADTGEDFVQGESYRVGGNENGLIGTLSLPENPSTDLIDRQKIRGKTNSALIPSFNEDPPGFVFVSVEAIDGPVRVLRALTLSLLGLAEAPLPFFYYRNSFALEGDLAIPADLPLGIAITEVRHSIDLAPAASGMTFANPFNSNVSVNGVDDTVDDSISVAPKFNFTHITGNQGTIISLFQLPGSIGDQRRLFYLDRTGVGDPGDGNSYGDSGVIITGADIEGDFPLSLKFILMGPNQPSSLGELFARQEETPLIAEVTSEESGTVSVEASDLTELPDEFELFQNFPNPFNPTTEIKFRIPANPDNVATPTATTLTIFNLRGERVRVLVDERLAPGLHVTRWDGRDRQGRLVASGVYLYQLISADRQTSRKMLFVK